MRALRRRPPAEGAMAMSASWERTRRPGSGSPRRPVAGAGCRRDPSRRGRRCRSALPPLFRLLQINLRLGFFAAGEGDGEFAAVVHPAEAAVGGQDDAPGLAADVGHVADGKLQRGRDNFSLSSRNIRLSGHTLSAECRRKDGVTWLSSSFSLDDAIENENGVLVWKN